MLSNVCLSVSVIMTRNEQVSEELNIFSEKRNSRREPIQNECYTEMDDSIAKSEQPLCEGSDSGVEMNSKCTCHRSTLAEADSETDSCLMGNSNGYSPSIYFCTDTNDLVSSTIRQLSVGECEHNGENSPMSYDAASENGSESSSVDDSKKCKSNCGTVSKLSSYCTKVNRRQATTSSGRSRSSPFPTDALKFGASKPSSNPKCALSISDPDAVKSKLPVTEARNRSIRSCSVTRTRTPVSPDETKCTADSRLSRNRGLPSAGMSEKITTFDTYATLPRRKQREVADSKNSPRDPSLNRAASLRKKFLENSLMTTSMNASIGSSSSPSPSSFSRTLPPYVKARQIKTKIYLEAASQTLLTNDDVDHALSDHPFNIYNEVEIQVCGVLLLELYYNILMSFHWFKLKTKNLNCLFYKLHFLKSRKIFYFRIGVF